MRKLLGSFFGCPVVVEQEPLYKAGDTVWIRGFSFGGLRQAKIAQVISSEVYVVYDIDESVMKSIANTVNGKQYFEILNDAIVAKVELSNETSNS